MIALLATVLVAGVTGSLHCAAMCGPFAGLSQHQPAYAAGRLAAYLLLGMLAGAVGAAVDLAGDLAAIGPVAMIVAALAIIGWGALSLGRALGVLRSPSPTAAAAQPMLYAIRSRRRALRASLIGAFTVLLPCGWLWAFVIVAAGTGAPWWGAAVMAALWLGSAPALLGAGLTMRALARRLGARLPLVTASLQIAVGVVALAIRAPILDATPHQATTEVPSEPSCH